MQAQRVGRLIEIKELLDEEKLNECRDGKEVFIPQHQLRILNANRVPVRKSRKNRSLIKVVDKHKMDAKVLVFSYRTHYGQR